MRSQMHKHVICRYFEAPAKEGAIWHLETPVQGPLNGDALRRVGAVRGDRRDERVQLISLLLQLLHQGLDGSLAK